MTRKPAARDQRGLTIIELLVVMLLTAILSAGLYAMTIGQSRTYTSQLTSLNTQQNLWGAMEYLQRQVRSAGWGQAGGSACPNGTIIAYNSGAPGPLPSGSVLIGFRGFNNCSLYNYEVGGGAFTFPPLPAACVFGPLNNGPDSFAVTYSNAIWGGTGRLPTVSITKGMPNQSANIKVSECRSTFSCPSCVPPNQPLIVIDPNCLPSDPDPCCKKCYLMKVTHDTSTCTAADCALPDTNPLHCCSNHKECHLQHHPDGTYNPPGGNNLFGKCKIKAGAKVSNYQGSGSITLHFGIDTARNRLMQWTQANAADAEVIAEDIEDMQLSWACDQNLNGVLDEGVTALARTTDEWAYNVPGDVPPTCVDGVGTPIPVRAVRITLIGRAKNAEMGSNLGFRPPHEDRPTGTTPQDIALSGNTGTYRRSVLTSTVLLRNTK